MKFRKHTHTQRWIAAMLSLVMILSMLPVLTSAASNTYTGKVADPSTMDSWKSFFDPDNVTTEHAGGIWTDKSVFAGSLTGFKSEAGEALTLNSASDSFLVALSALAANSVVVGKTSTPTDTVFVLDVSNSMSGTALSSMVTATNNAISTLMENPENRVSVILYGYSGSVLLPLDHYTPVQIGGNDAYIQLSDGYIRGARVRSGGRWNYVTNSDGESVTTSIRAYGATYIQSGLYRAYEEFSAATDVSNRTPVLVLMSDGAPTYSTDAYSNVPEDSNYGSGSSSREGDGFVTQLTAAWVKAQMAAKYGKNAYFYTLGLGVEDIAIAEAVLDPANKQTADIADYWTEFLAAPVNGSVDVEMYGRSITTVDITKVDNTITSSKYVDRYFTAVQASNLNDAFQNIVNEINLQAGYYPTHLDDNGANYSGYISFVDEIGMGMEVRNIHGLVIDGTLYTGEHLAKVFWMTEQNNNNNGTYTEVLGTKTGPTAMGDEFIRAVKNRMGITADTLEQANAIAYALVDNAWAKGQLSCTVEMVNGVETVTSFSNYIGWYGDANNQYLGFDDTAKAAATYYNKCYGMLGEAGDSNTMYITIQVREEIATGHEAVIFNIPSSLLPVVTYEIEVNGDTITENTNATLNYHGETPIRLVFEVGVRSEMNSMNISQILPDGYQRNSDGTYHLWTNHWYSPSTATPGAAGNPSDDELKNSANNHFTYAYFVPSVENEHYYFTENSVIYVSDGNGGYTEFAGNSLDSNGTYYFAHRIFSHDGATENSAKVRYVYEQISQLALSFAAQDGNNWYIPKGSMHRNMHSHDLFKGAQNADGGYNASGNPTGSYQMVRNQIVDATVSRSDSMHYELIYLGNNGRITVEPAQGIELSKVMAEGASATGNFGFTITLIPNGKDIASTYETMLTKVNGDNVSGSVDVSNNQIRVTLAAGETIRIIGLDDGIGYTIVEDEIDGYRVDKINGVSASTAVGEIEKYKFSSVVFTNAIQEYSTLSVVKSVTYNKGTSGSTADFPVTVTFQKNGTAWANKTITVDGVQKTTGADGTYSFTIRDGGRVTIGNLPVGVTYEVVETMDASFEGYEWTNANDANLNGTVTVDASFVVLRNSYTPKDVKINPTNPAIQIGGTKVLRDASGNVMSDWNGYSFTFLLEKLNEDGVTWDVLEEKTLTSSDTSKTYTFDLTGEPFTSVGTYSYRVQEKTVTADGINYDTTVHDFAVIVTDLDLDGYLEISDVREVQHANIQKVSDGVWHIDADFNNVYDPDDAFLTMSGTKTYTGATMQGGEFSFVLTGLNGAPMPEGTTGNTVTVTNGADGSIIFPTIVYTATGEYKYTITEVDGGKGGVTYDSNKVVNVTVNVEKVGATLVAKASYSTPATAASNTFGFTNSYKATMKTGVIIKGTKTLNGRDIDGPEFSFRLLNSDGTEKETVSVSGGKFQFSELTFDAAGTYNFTVVEVQGNKGGITYDKTVHNVVVTVTDNGKGDLVASYTVDNVANGTADFVNTYTATMKTPIVLGGVKKLNGRNIIDGEFTFTLTKPDGSVETVVNKGESFTFSPMTFTSAGTYKCTISEVKGSKGGVTYDEASYTVEIVVKDDGLGNLTATASLANENIVFTNTYTTTDAKLTISGHKYLDGRDLNDQEFTFVLTGLNGAPMPADNETSNNAAGLFSFGEITYTAPGTYEYTVTEKQNGVGGIIYDETIYDVTVNVVDNGYGQLVAGMHVTAEEAEGNILQFFNRYQAAPVEWTPEGIKTLVNLHTGNSEVPADNRFSFTLTHPDGTTETVKNVGGKFTFGTVTFQKAGVYSFTIAEDDLAEAGIRYDSASYKITVTVIDEGDGQLKKTVDISKVTAEGEANATEVAFENKYQATATDITIAGQKYFNSKYTDIGLNMTAGQFSFTMTHPDGTAETVTNDESGKFSFAKIDLVNPGVYEYTIVEVEGTDNAIAYDKTTYTVKVTVTDVNGVLTKDVEIIGGANANEVGFTNIFTPSAKSAEILIKKTLVNKSYEQMGPGGFQFKLTCSETGASFTVSSDDNGDARFAGSEHGLEFSGQDIGKTFHFVLTEVDTDIEYMTYSDASYEITVTVGQNAETGEIELTVSKTDAAEFVNTYEPPVDTSPKTFDEMNLMGMIGIMSLSAICLLAVIVLGKKRFADMI